MELKKTSNYNKIESSDKINRREHIKVSPFAIAAVTATAVWQPAA